CLLRTVRSESARDITRLDVRRAPPGPLGGLLLALPLGAAPQRPHVVEYTIEASLDPATHELAGKERLLWRNPSGDAVSELQFHTYLNAFKNNLSTMMRESGGQLRGDRASKKSDAWGWIDVLSIRDASGQDLRPGAA